MIMKSPSFFSLETFFFLLFCWLDQCSCESLYSPSDYERCAPFVCGNLNVSFPFYLSDKTADNPRCGLPGYELSCHPSSQTLTFSLQGKLYQVKGIFYSESLITVNDSSLVNDLQYGNCDGPENFTISDRVQLVASSTNLTLFRCPRGLDVNLSASFQMKVLNYTGCRGDSNLFISADLFIAADGSSPLGCDDNIKHPDDCRCISVPVLAASLTNVSNLNILSGPGLLNVLSRGFPLHWRTDRECGTCQVSGGRCGYDVNSKKTICLTRFEPKKSKRSKRWKVIIGVSSAAAFLIALGALAVMKFRGKPLYIFKMDHFKSKSSRDDDRNVQQFIKSYQSTLVNRYSYYEIQKMTDNLKDKIGQGGYGKVYKGKLADGRLIAAKILEKSRDSGQDFINEVTTIGHIHHVNVIRLLGFCCDGSKRVLIYEFMHGGSLGNLISDKNAGLCLDWAKLLEIAIGIARGIEYLHQGCDTRILHLDIKPQNVLLDHDHNPKISDFGLAKSYSRKHSAVALSDARGTIGYIAPEVFLRNLGGVSHKSDVYSYGMLLLEMVGVRKNAEWEAENSSEKYFPDWIYHQVTREGGMEIVDSIVEEDTIVARKMVMVGLWCIQMNPAERPSMSGVLEMLTEKLEAIGMPPKPSLFSPPRPRSHPDSFDRSSDTQETAFFSISLSATDL